MDRRVGAQVELAEQLDAVEGLQRLARDRGVEEQPHKDVERPDLGSSKHGPRGKYSGERGNCGTTLGLEGWV